jgi:outer membrane protein
MNKYLKIVVTLNLLLVASLGTYILFGKKNLKTGYVEVSKVYQDFKMTKELEKKYEVVSNSRKLFLDSLEITLRTIVNQKDKIEEFNRVKKEYMVRKQQFEQDNQAMNSQYTKQIMTQLNQYMEDYGKQNGYDFVFGANGNGSLMYVDENAYDITTAVTGFVNSKYDGKEK